MKKLGEFWKFWGKITICASAILFLLVCIVKSDDADMVGIDDMKEVKYTEFLTLVKTHKVDTVFYRSDEEYMYFTLFNEKTAKMDEKERKKYEYKPSDYRKSLYPAYEDFRKDMLGYDVNLEVYNSRDNTLSVLSGLLTLAFPIALLVMLFSTARSSMLNFGGTKSDDLIKTSDVKFENIIGHDEVVDDVKFVVELLKDPSKAEEIGAKIPRGILLSGSPGTGKTLIAKAIAGEAGVPFIYMNSSGMNEIFVGVGAKRVREIFKKAKENAPCVIFIDEIDAIGGKRSMKGDGTSEADNTLNALLTELDGFDGREGIFVIAATNRADKLDKALKRAGRFDRQIIVNPPRDWKVRKELFEYYLKKLKVADDVDVDTLSKQVAGFTGADIEAVCNEAGVIAVMRGSDRITHDNIVEAIDKKIFKGNRSKEDHFKSDKKVVAFHEAGHAVLRWVFNMPIARASIQSTTSGVGGVVFGEDSNSVLMSADECRNEVMVLYGGRASEEVMLGGVTTGASNDIEKATQLLKGYVSEYGFDDSFGLVNMQVLMENTLVSEDRVLMRVQELSKELYGEAVKKLTDNMELVEKLANELLEHEVLAGDEIKKLFTSEK